MPTAVLDVDSANLPQAFTGLESFDKALFLVRFGREPIGRVTAPVSAGRITRASLESGFDQNIWYAIQHRLLRRFLEIPDSEPVGALPSATVAICTRDRPADLQICLAGVLQLLPDGQDVLVVDNNPSDDCSLEVVRAFPSVRYVREPKPGLDHARNRALQEATGEIVAFIDDDARPEPDWLRALLANYQQPLVMAVTGLTMPSELTAPAQEQFETFAPFSRGFERRVFGGLRTHPLASGGIGAGTNMSVRRSVLALLGGFDVSLDAGTLTQSGGDHEMFTRILSRGYRIIYEPRAVNWHRHRRTYAELRKTIHGYGVGAYASLTRSLIVEGEWGVFGVAATWFWRDQWRNLMKALLKRRNAKPLDLVVAELQGCLQGPMAYFRARRRSRAYGAL